MCVGACPTNCRTKSSKPLQAAALRTAPLSVALLAIMHPSSASLFLSSKYLHDRSTHTYHLRPKQRSAMDYVSSAMS